MMRFNLFTPTLLTRRFFESSSLYCPVNYVGNFVAFFAGESRRWTLKDGNSFAFTTAILSSASNHFSSVDVVRFATLKAGALYHDGVLHLPGESKSRPVPSAKGVARDAVRNGSVFSFRNRDGKVIRCNPFPTGRARLRGSPATLSKQRQEYHLAVERYRHRKQGSVGIECALARHSR